MNSIVAQYLGVVDAIYGVYLDGTRAFHLLRKEIDTNQRHTISTVPGTTIEQLDAASMIYGVGDPNTPEAYPLHVCTQREYKERNEGHGRNYRTIGNLCLVQIYQYWEDEYRQKVADELRVAKNQVAAHVMGDLRFLRMSIVHHRGIALADVEKCRLLKWFHEGDEIFVTKDQFEQLIFHLKKYCDTLLEQ